MIPNKAQAVADTLRFLSGGWIGSPKDQEWCADAAREIEGFDWVEAGWACPLCQEVVCDDGCPLAGLR